MAIPCCQNAKTSKDLKHQQIWTRDSSFKDTTLSLTVLANIGPGQIPKRHLLLNVYLHRLPVYICLQMFVPACVNRGLAPAGAAGRYKYKSGPKYKTRTMDGSCRVGPQSIASNYRGLSTVYFVATLILTHLLQTNHFPVTEWVSKQHLKIYNISHMS